MHVRADAIYLYTDLIKHGAPEHYSIGRPVKNRVVYAIGGIPCELFPYLRIFFDQFRTSHAVFFAYRFSRNKVLQSLRTIYRKVLASDLKAECRRLDRAIDDPHAVDPR